MPSQPPKVTGRHKDTLRQVFAHPLSHNVEWHAVVSLLRQITVVQERDEGKIEITVGDGNFVLPRPHGKDVSADELMEVRHVLEALGYSEKDH